LKEKIIKLEKEIEQRLTREEVERQIDEALKGQLSSTKGKVSERVAPVFQEFFSKYKAADCWFIGNLIDFIVFQGYSEGDTEKIIFVEVKTEKSDLKPNERKIRNLIENIRSQSDKVDWDLARLKMETDGEEKANAISKAT
jgi:predicted Holliday junction resolvase-like endonuclease